MGQNLGLRGPEIFRLNFIHFVPRHCQWQLAEPFDQSLLDPHGMPMGCPWDAHGMPMGKGAVGKRDGTEKNIRKEHHAMTPGEIIIIYI